MGAEFHNLELWVSSTLDTLRYDGRGGEAASLQEAWLAYKAILLQKNGPAASPADSQSEPSNPKLAPPPPEGENNAQNNRYAAEVGLLAGVSEVLSERQADYGPNPFNNETTGKAWEAILEARWQTKLPGAIDGVAVALMMASLKLTRAATPFGFRTDNYTDMVGYSMIAHRCDPRSQQRKVEG